MLIEINTAAAVVISLYKIPIFTVNVSNSKVTVWLVCLYMIWGCSG